MEVQEKNRVDKEKNYIFPNNKHSKESINKNHSPAHKVLKLCRFLIYFSKKFLVVYKI